LILAVFCPEMPCEVRITDNARQDFLGLDARWHSAVKAAVEAHLRLGPATMIKVPLATVKDDLSGYVRKSAQDEVLITRHGKPAALLIGFASTEWFGDSRLIDCHPRRRSWCLLRSLMVVCEHRPLYAVLGNRCVTPP